MKLLLAIAASLTPHVGWAQTATVQSGEHSDFSRLVINGAGVGDDWTIAESADGFAISVGGRTTNLDVSRVFNLIPRDRIASITATSSTLQLGVTCDCYVRAFLAGPDNLVIDVADGPSQHLAVFPNARLLPAPDIVSRPIARPAQGASSPRNVSEHPASDRPDVTLPLLSQRQTAAPLDLSSIAPTVPPAPPDASLTHAERAILESFARAATQGVFDFPARPVTPLSDLEQRPRPVRLTPTTDPMDGVPVPIVDSDPPGPGLVLRSSIERDIEDTLARPAPCADPRLIDITTWGINEAYSIVIPELRAEVTNAAGHEEADAMVTLAKAYVFYGFGQEALQALALSGRETREATYVANLARLVDGLPVPPVELVALRSCGPAVEPWITLASGRLDTSQDRLKTAVMVGHRTFPRAIRGHLGLRLADIFLAADELNMAQQILDVSEMAPTGVGYAAAVAQANLDGLREGPLAEAEALDTLVSQNARATPEVMTRRLDLALELDDPIADDTLALSAAIRFEAEDSPAATDLAVAEIRALAAANQFDAARELWHMTHNNMTPPQQTSSYAEITIGMAQRAADGPFLQMAYASHEVELSGSSRHAIARRLLALGFPDHAISLISDHASTTQDEHVLRAQIHADLGQSADALIAVQGIQTAQANMIRGDILGTDVQTLTPEQAWRDGDWQSLQSGDDALLAGAADALLSLPPPAGDETRLEDSRTLLDSAEQTRAMTRDLLDRFSLNDPETSTQ